MNNLQDILEIFREELPPPEEFDEDALFEFDMMYGEEVPGFDGRFWSFSESSVAELPDQLSRLYFALWYVQSMGNFYNAVGGDGLLSVFYNNSGEEIDALRSVLNRFNDPLHQLVDEAYSLLEPTYQFVPDNNYVSRYMESDLHEVLPEEVALRIQEIEAEVEGMQDGCSDRVLTAYREAWS